MPNAALSSICVVDFSGVLAGPYCTLLPADFGADGIKIDSLESDESRQWVPPWREGESAYYLRVHGNKRSITRDLKSFKASPWRAVSWKEPTCSSKTSQQELYTCSLKINALSLQNVVGEFAPRVEE